MVTKISRSLKQISTISSTSQINLKKSQCISNPFPGWQVGSQIQHQAEQNGSIFGAAPGSPPELPGVHLPDVRGFEFSEGRGDFGDLLNAFGGIHENHKLRKHVGLYLSVIMIFRFGCSLACKTSPPRFSYALVSKYSYALVFSRLLYTLEEPYTNSTNRELYQQSQAQSLIQK